MRKKVKKPGFIISFLSIPIKIKIPDTMTNGSVTEPIMSLKTAEFINLFQTPVSGNGKESRA